MTFLNPWAIWIGVLAAGLPLAVHLLTRPRPVRMPLSTLRFVREAIRQRRARHRLRDFVVLLLRTVAIVLLALALARPQFGGRSPISQQSEDDTLRVVILDVSQSMAATDGGIKAMERARTVAAGYLAYRPRLSANLILAGASPRGVFDAPSTNFAALREDLAAREALPQRADVNGALDMAAEMLAGSSKDDQRRREVIVVSDFQRSNWARADFARLPKNTHIQLESVAPAEEPSNVAILNATAHSQSAAGGGVRLAVEIGNFSPTARKVAVEVDLGSSTYRMEEVCPPGRITTISQEINIRHLGWQWGEARLVGNDDALPADDTRPLVVRVRPRPVYALITRQLASQRPSSSHFLECALLPDKRLGEKASAEVLRIDPSLVERRVLAPADMILLDHPGKLPEETITLLSALLRRGKPIVYIAGELIDATNLKRLCRASGGDLQMPVEFTPLAAGHTRRDAFIVSVRSSRAPFSVFGDNVAAVTGALRFSGGLGSRRLDTGLEDDVLATYGDGSACMVHCTSGNGSLAVINADLGASSLPKSKVFLPLLDKLVDEMLRDNNSVGQMLCGEMLLAALPEEISSNVGLALAGPPRGDVKDATADRSLGELVDQGVGLAWRWPSSESPGVYRVVQGEETLFCLAITTAAEESRLKSVSSKELTGSLAGEREVYYSGAADDNRQRDDFWKWLSVACVICMLGEIIALVSFRT